MQRYLQDLLARYTGFFCGESQVLSKIKEVFNFVEDPIWRDQLSNCERQKPWLLSSRQ